MAGRVDMGVCPITIIAAAALTAQRFVTALGAVPAAGANVLGVTSTDAAIGDPVTVDTLGVVTVESGAACTAGGLGQTDASGRVIDKAAGATVCRILDAATAAGQMVRVVPIPN